MLKFPQNLFESLNVSQIKPETLSCLEFLNIDEREKSQIFKGIDNKIKENIENLLKKIAIHQSETREKYIINGDIDPNKIKEFIDKFKKRFTEKSFMRSLLEKPSVICNRKDKITLSMNYIDFKSRY